MKNIRRKIIMLFLGIIMTCLKTSSIYEAADKSLLDYYNVIEEINRKYNATIAMPQEDELNIEKLSAMSLNEFENLIEDQYLQVSSKNIAVKDVMINGELCNQADIRSSGTKTQYCYIINSNGDRCGQFYLTADVVEAGVNQYTSIRKFGSEAITSCGYWFETIKSSYILSSDRKTCTVSYTGVFKNDLGLILTSQTTYKITYKVNGGNQYLLIGPSQEF